MSGFYNNWLKVQNPDMPNNVLPMESGGYQKPFYFGGSQVPVNLGVNEKVGSGINKKTDFLPSKLGKGIQGTSMSKSSNIHMPRTMKF